MLNVAFPVYNETGEIAAYDLRPTIAVTGAAHWIPSHK
jgi:hypothetical protein